MTILTCMRGHTYSGWSCPTCDLIDAQESQLREARRDAEDRSFEARHEMERLAEEQQAREDARREEEAWEREYEAEQQQKRLQEHADRIKDTISRRDELQGERLLQQSGTLRKAGLYQDAASILTRAVELDPVNANIRFELAWALFQTNQRATSRLQFDSGFRLATMSSLDGPVLRNTVLPLAVELGGSPLASTIAKSLCKDQADWLALGDLCWQCLGELSPEVVWKVAMHAKANGDKRITSKLGQVLDDSCMGLSKQGDYNGAIEVIRQAIALVDKTDICRTLVHITDDAYSRDDYRSMLGYAQFAREHSFESAAITSKLGQVLDDSCMGLSKQGKYKEAIEVIRQSISLVDATDIRRTLVHVAADAYSRDDYRSMLGYAQFAREHSFESATLLLYQACGRALMNNEEGALLSLQQAALIDSSFLEAAPEDLESRSYWHLFRSSHLRISESLSKAAANWIADEEGMGQELSGWNRFAKLKQFVRDGHSYGTLELIRDEPLIRAELDVATRAHDRLIRLKSRLNRILRCLEIQNDFGRGHSSTNMLIIIGFILVLVSGVAGAWVAGSGVWRLLGAVIGVVAALVASFVGVLVHAMIVTVPKQLSQTDIETLSSFKGDAIRLHSELDALLQAGSHASVGEESDAPNQDAEALFAEISKLLLTSDSLIAAAEEICKGMVERNEARLRKP